MVCFLGSRLHGVNNKECSFSFGLHYRCKTDNFDEWVVYVVLSGHKQIVLIDCERNLQAYIHSLEIMVDPGMFMEGSCYDSIRSAVTRAHGDDAVSHV